MVLDRKARESYKNRRRGGCTVETIIDCEMQRELHRAKARRSQMKRSQLDYEMQRELRKMVGELRSTQTDLEILLLDLDEDSPQKPAGGPPVLREELMAAINEAIEKHIKPAIKDLDVAAKIRPAEAWEAEEKAKSKEHKKAGK